MKKYIFIVSLLCLLAACTGKRQGEAAAKVAALPAVEDVVMYQVNPRVFAPEKPFRHWESTWCGLCRSMKWGRRNQ